MKNLKNVCTLTVILFMCALNSFGQNSGSLDTSFSSNVTLSSCSLIYPMSNGEVLVAGTQGNGGGNVLYKLKPNGNEDTNFTPFSNSQINDIDTLNNGQILIAGSDSLYFLSSVSGKHLKSIKFGKSNSHCTQILKISTFSIDTFLVSFDDTIYKIDNNGNLLNGFTSPDLSSFGVGRISILTKQSINQIIVAFNYAIIRIDGNGVVDTSFKGSNIIKHPSSYSMYSIRFQTNYKILVEGYFTLTGQSVQSQVFRLNADGSLDNSFATPQLVGIGSYSLLPIASMYVQTNDSILIGGYFSSPTNSIMRLTPNGSIDNSFNVSSGTNDAVRAINIQNDGKILIGGAFTNVQGQSENYIARLYGQQQLSAGICYVSVSDSLNKSVLLWYPQTGQHIANYTIYRENSNSQFDSIASVIFNNAGKYIDATSTPDAFIQTYAITVTDSSGNVSILSNAKSTILAINFASTSGSVEISWSAPIGINSIAGYYIFESSNGILTLIDSVPNNVFLYTVVNPVTNAQYLVSIAHDNCINDPNGRVMKNGSDAAILSNKVSAHIAGIENYKNNFDINVYPNPNNGQFSILNTPINSTIEIYNMLGKCVWSKLNNQQVLQNINISNLSDGIYLLKTTTNTGLSVNKIQVVN